MLYKQLTIWEHNGEIWHAYRGDSNHRDLAMGILKPWQVKKAIAFATMHNTKIIDKREPQK